MKYRQLGSTGLQVSLLGLGTVKLGRNTDVKYPTTFQIPDDRSASVLLDRARELGVNLLDTAPAYGYSEQRLGQLLRGQRQHWIIGTKTGEEFENGQSHFDFSSKQTRDSVERSLRRLETDYLDIVLVHSDGNDVSILDNSPALEVLMTLKKEGKIRAVGMSTKTIEGGLRCAASADVVMVAYNPTDAEQQTVIDYCYRHNKGVLVKKAFGSGHLVTSSRLPGAASPSVDIGNTARECLSFVCKEPGVSSIIVGTISTDHLQHNAQLIDEICP